MDKDKLKQFFARKKDKEDTTASNAPAIKHDLSAPQESNEIKHIVSLCKELDLPFLNISLYKIDMSVAKLIPEELARTYKVIPIAKFGNTLTIAINDPFDIVAIDSIKAATKSDIQLILSSPSEIIKAIDDYYNLINLEKALSRQEESLGQGEQTTGQGEIAKEISELSQRKQIIENIYSQEKINIEEIAELSQTTQIVEMVNDILIKALKQRASDIHIEPYPDVLRIRYRIDGSLQERESIINKKYEQAIIARFKIMSKLDITQRRLPQDGRISITLESRDIDLRVSILPLTSGEKVVLRILEKGSLQLDLERLGFSLYPLEAFKKVSAKPHGMILITGPTGSGKSTTLYAILNRLNNTEKNIITIEDPVEYQMKGITQIQVKPEIGLTFVNVLRAVLRQNPDVAMVGEIRDFDTVDIAIKAALTGHLILSTLHTNDAPSAVVRLMNMGVEPFLISSTLTLIAAQRLCRKVCPSCKEAYETSVVNLVGLPKGFNQTKATFYRGKGCTECNNTGYFGRVAVVEALIIDDNVRQMILEKVSITKIREYSRNQGMRTLREDAVEKCLAGEVSLEEAIKVTPES